tara:strand:- start:24092 stop:24577 length:486 start_codon:yes stop_codon:yes gene_type:complete
VEASEFSLEVLIACAVLVLLAGLALGVLIGRRTSSSGQKYREVERKLDQVLQDKKRYEDDVVEHFTETAQLLNSLTDSYRQVHNHLAKGASTLCQGEGPVALDHLTNNRDPEDIPADLVPIRPPLDYAPKSSPDEKGMLNEEFGIERQSSAQAAGKKGDKH